MDKRDRTASLRVLAILSLLSFHFISLSSPGSANFVFLVYSFVFCFLLCLMFNFGFSTVVFRTVLTMNRCSFRMQCRRTQKRSSTALLPDPLSRPIMNYTYRSISVSSIHNLCAIGNVDSRDLSLSTDSRYKVFVL